MYPFKVGLVMQLQNQTGEVHRNLDEIDEATVIIILQREMNLCVTQIIKEEILLIKNLPITCR